MFTCWMDVDMEEIMLYITISMCKLVVVGLKLSSRRDLVSDKRDAL